MEQLATAASGQRPSASATAISTRTQVAVQGPASEEGETSNAPPWPRPGLRKYIVTAVALGAMAILVGALVVAWWVID